MPGTVWGAAEFESEFPYVLGLIACFLPDFAAKCDLTELPMRSCSVLMACTVGFLGTEEFLELMASHWIAYQMKFEQELTEYQIQAKKLEPK